MREAESGNCVICPRGTGSDITEATSCTFFCSSFVLHFLIKKQIHTSLPCLFHISSQHVTPDMVFTDTNACHVGRVSERRFIDLS